MAKEAAFRSISLGGSLYQEIEDFVENSLRYKSVAEFVSEAARLRLEQLERLQLKKDAKGARNP